MYIIYIIYIYIYMNLPLISHWNSIEHRGAFSFAKKKHVTTGTSVRRKTRPPRSSIHVSRGTKAWEICRDLRAITGDEPPEELLRSKGISLKTPIFFKGSINQASTIGHIYHQLSSYINVTENEMSTSLGATEILGASQKCDHVFCWWVASIQAWVASRKYDLQWLEIVDTLTA